MGSERDQRSPVWAHPTDDGWVLQLRIQPGATRTGVVGELGEALKVRIAAPADDGKANAELVRFLARRLGVPQRAVQIVRGQRSRTKSVKVTGSAAPDDLLSD